MNELDKAREIEAPIGGRRHAVSLLLCLCLLPAFATTGCAGPIRNVILCIGDGMGPEQVTAAAYFAGTNLFFETFPYQSQMTTACADAAVTDSAAAASAMATGIKVNYLVVSVALPGDGCELETMLEYFQARDKAAGLVTTTYLTHATPAAFGAHEATRNNLSQIAVDYLTQTRPNVLFGGGANGMSGPAAEAAGYTVVTNRETLFALDPDAETHVSGQFGTSNLPYESDGLGTLPHLSEMTAVALDILDNDPDGFFLMVEGGKIDHACHANHLSRSIAETLEFDAAVRVVATWAEGREDTLIIVTADHETGGLTVLADNGKDSNPTVTWSTTGHTDTPVPVYGWGLNAHLVTNVTDNTNIYQVAVSPTLVPERCLGVQEAGPGELHMEWTAASGGVYRVESSPSLTLPDWGPLSTVTATATRLHVMVTNSTAGASRFYRLISTDGAVR